MRYLVITVDTEGDNLWSRPRKITTENARYLPRFQSLCEKYGFGPTYLVSVEMCDNPFFVSFISKRLAEKACDVGSHPHAWLCPPQWPLTADDMVYQPLMTEFPSDVMEQKLVFITNLLSDRFEKQVSCHRGGRWAIDERYFIMLMRLGYTHDSTVTPYVRWDVHPSDRGKPVVLDYRFFPDHPYRITKVETDRSGANVMVEVPVTIRPKRTWKNEVKSRLHFIPLLRDRFPLALEWLRPNGRNLESMRELVRDPCIKTLVFAIHSSELMPAGSPYFRTLESIEVLYKHIETILRDARDAGIRHSFLMDVLPES